MVKTNYIINILSGIALLFIFSTCEKLNDCSTRTGKIIIEQRNITNFSSISVNENINLVLAQDTFNSVKIEAGENLLTGIITEESNNLLTISNENTCEWARSYKNEITAYVTFKELNELRIYTSGNVTASDTLLFTSFKYTAGKANGTTKLTINCKRLSIGFQGGTGNINISGKGEYLHASTYSSGRLNLQHFNSDSTYISALCPNNNYVYASKWISIVNNGVGNIYYSGNPQKKNITLNNTGKAIPISKQ